MARELTDANTEATVVTAAGEPIGTVARVEDGVAYVTPEDVPDTLAATLGWEVDEETEHPLPRTAIESMAEDEVRLRRGDADPDRADDGDPHEPDVSLAAEADDDATNGRASEEVAERARENDAERDGEESEEREAAARDSANPDAHRDEEPFNG